MSEADRDKWQARYRDAPPPVPGAPGWLAQRLSPSRPLAPALDVACGRGELSLWLAERGFEVWALDIAETALERLAQQATERELPVHTLARDLDAPPPLQGEFELITCLHFKPPGGLAPYLDLLAEGGRLVLETATVVNLQRHAHPSRRWLVEPDQWGQEVRSYRGAELELDEADWFHGRHLSRVIARRGFARSDG